MQPPRRRHRPHRCRRQPFRALPRGHCSDRHCGPRQGSRLRHRRSGGCRPRTRDFARSPKALHRDQSLRKRKRPPLPHAYRPALRRRERSRPDHQVEGDLRSHRNRRRQVRRRRQRHRRRHSEERVTFAMPQILARLAAIPPLLLAVVLLTFAFEFSNGWHDAANSIATVVSTRVLKPFTAVAWAAFWNFIAAFFFGTAVASTIGKGLVRIDMINEQVILAGLLGAITWNLTTLILGLPTSSSHALMGGYGGAAVAHVGYQALILQGWVKPVLFIFLSPLVGMALAILLTTLASWIGPHH